MLSFPSIVFYSIFLSLPFFLVLAPQYHTTITPHSTLQTPNGPKPKIAFLFLTNSNLTFSPLWEKFFLQNQNKNKNNQKNLFNIYIHSDPSLNITLPNGLFHRRLIPSIKTHRSSPSLISAARRLLAAALSDDPQNYYFALLSQHCIPLHSFSFTYNHLFNFQTPPSKSPLLMSTTSFLNWGSLKKRSFHKSFIEILSDEPNLFDRYAARGFHVMLPEIPFEEFKVGSQFFVLKREHAEIVVRDERVWSKFKVGCVSDEPCYPEEHYFPTLLSMEDREGCTGFTLTRVNWTGCWDGHPHRYEPPEVSAELVRRLRDSNSSYEYLFARKFAPECLPALMDLADDVIFRD